MEEIFELSKDVWAAQSRAKGKDETEISETEFLALDFLFKSPVPQTVGDIQRYIGVLPAQMSRVIRSLESKGEKPLIRCSINLQDKRKIDVELTDEGRHAHHGYREMKLGSIQKMLLVLSERDREEFVRILRQIRTSMRNSNDNKQLRKTAEK
jgi:DNA-binding MarR family transcriptional regulator